MSQVSIKSHLQLGKSGSPFSYEILPPSPIILKVYLLWLAFTWINLILISVPELGLAISRPFSPLLSLESKSYHDIPLLLLKILPRHTDQVLNSLTKFSNNCGSQINMSTQTFFLVAYLVLMGGGGLFLDIKK